MIVRSPHVVQPFLSTWIFENDGTKLRRFFQNRVSNSATFSKTVYQIPPHFPKPCIKFRRIFQNRVSNSATFSERRTLRTLDAELKAHSKASEPGWEWAKLSFVLELKGLAQDEELSKAQKKVNSALQSSLQAGFSLVETNLQNDQVQHRRYVLTSSGDEAKARAAVVASLEDRMMKHDESQTWLSFKK